MVVGVDELIEVLGIEVLLDHEVVGHGTVLVLGVETLDLCFRFVELSAQVLDLLVRLLGSQFSFTEREIGLQVRYLVLEPVVFEGKNIGPGLLVLRDGRGGVERTQYKAHAIFEALRNVGDQPLH